jgi:ankyrin repeat protein
MPVPALSALLLLALFAFLALAGAQQDFQVNTDAEEYATLPEQSRTFSKELASETDPALMRAASHGDFDLVSEFLRSGHHFNEQNAQGWTALTFAVANGYSDIASEVNAIV